MFSSFFSTVAPADPNAPNFHPVSDLFKPDELYGELDPKDTEWVCPGGFAVETHTYYNVLQDGTSIMCQVIHSAVGVWYPTIQFTCKIANPNTHEKIWKSVNVSNFVTPPPGLDRRSSRGDQYSITHKTHPDSDGSGSDAAAPAESYTITANLGDDLQISLDVSRARGAPGFKVGRGPQGGFSYFGPDRAHPESYVLHRFWPRTHARGVLTLRGRAIDAQGPGMYVHAVQGMRPNLVAARWNFVHFQSEALGGVSAVQMEFTTTDAYGCGKKGAKGGAGDGAKEGAREGFVTVNVGSLVVAGQLVGVTAETRYRSTPLPDADASAESTRVVSRVTHTKTALDADTGYAAPTEVLFEWAAPSLARVPGAPGRVAAEVRFEVGPPDAYRGLIEKVDVLAEIPYVIKTMVNYVAGTKPYIYQWNNRAALRVTGPDALVPGLAQGLDVEGWLYNEATFIS
ncbi:hypothetical protein EIP86_007785 [Pleurotus ostreatoroseus]|nr:hypothetical protein EIP86_007785 [Pleurotus ostreatoroseus]